MTDKRMAARRYFLRQALAMAAVSGGGLLPTLVEAMSKAPKLPAGRSIYQLEGEVWVDGKAAKPTTPVSADSLIETSANSHVIFAVGKDAHILRANSRLQLQGSHVLEKGLRLLTGKLLSVFGSREEAEDDYHAQTPIVSIAIRGTGLYMESEAARSYVCTCYGEVELVAKNDPSSREAIVSRHHDAPRYIAKSGKPGELITPAPVKDHTDAELILIEALVGREPPFVNSFFYSPDGSY